MRKEIDMLLHAASLDCAVVEKASNLIWSSEELAAARDHGQYEGEDQLLAPDSRAAVTSPYPGCCQQGSALSARNFRAVCQTEHFIIFAPNSEATAASNAES